MKKERFKSKNANIYIPVVLLTLGIMCGNYTNFVLNDYLIVIGLVAIWFLIVLDSKFRTYLEIQDSRMLTNSGYRTFGKDMIDIFDIKYIYRHPEFIVRYYGSRMVFYIKDDQGKLRQSSLREVNYSNDTLVNFLKRIKEIRPTIELDPEYEKIIKGEMFLNDASDNTVASVEERLKAKGDSWK